MSRFEEPYQGRERARERRLAYLKPSNMGIDSDIPPVNSSRKPKTSVWEVQNKGEDIWDRQTKAGKP